MSDEQAVRAVGKKRGTNGHLSVANRVKKALLILVASFTLLVLVFFGLRPYQRQFWERMLDGPFTGITYNASITNVPVSVLTVPSLGQFEVHEFQSLTNPVVLLRSPIGAVRWSRVLRPEKTYGDSPTYSAVRELRLENWEQRSTGSVVYVTCDWDWGGKGEGGLIELDTNHMFRSFSLSW